MTLKNIKTIFIISIFFLISKNIYTQTVDTSFVDGWIYVKIDDTASIELSPYNFSDPALNALYATYSIDTITKPFSGINTTLDKTYRVVFSQINLIDNLVADFQLLSYIEYAEKVPLYKTSLAPNDLQATQWALTKINALQAWDITTGSNTVTVAIVDNAVSTTHEDLVDNIWVNPDETPNNFLDDDLNGFTDDVKGWDVADNDNDPNPPASATTGSPFVHGTHCAGIASATTNNGIGIASIGFGINIIGVKCSQDASSDQGNSLPYAYDGVFYAMRADANIISMSWGGSSGLFITGENLINTAHSLGIVLVAAAGNNNNSTAHYPSAYNNVISVGATDQADQKASFSNFGPTVDVMAPGVSIYSTLSGTNNAYGSLSGTSMACPMVAGLAGLILSENSNLSPANVESALKNGCENIDLQNPSYVGQIGSGRINAFHSLQSTSNVEELMNKMEFHVFPNPSASKFTVAIGNETGLYKVSIFDPLGQLVFTSHSLFHNGKKEIDISNFKTGLYFIKAEGTSGSYVNKIIVKE